MNQHSRHLFRSYCQLLMNMSQRLRLKFLKMRHRPSNKMTCTRTPSNNVSMKTLPFYNDNLTCCDVIFLSVFSKCQQIPSFFANFCLFQTPSFSSTDKTLLLQVQRLRYFQTVLTEQHNWSQLFKHGNTSKVCKLVLVRDSACVQWLVLTLLLSLKSLKLIHFDMSTWPLQRVSRSDAASVFDNSLVRVSATHTNTPSQSLPSVSEQTAGALCYTGTPVCLCVCVCGSTTRTDVI